MLATVAKLILSGAIVLSTPPDKSATELADELLSGRIPADRFDYGALKGRADAAAYLNEMEARIKQKIYGARGIPAEKSWAEARVRCLTPRESQVRAGVWSARNAKSVAEWRDAVRQAADAEARRSSLVRALLAGAPSPFPAYKEVGKLIRLANEARDPVLAELFRRAAADQAQALTSAAGQRTFARGISLAAVNLMGSGKDPEECSLNRSNTAWLEAAIDKRGWFKLDVDGKEADEAAWVIVQHSDQNTRFQEKVLALLGPLVQSGQTAGSNYAYLYDRIAVNAGRPQRYGTQGTCRGRGRWEPYALEAPEDVDRLRAEAGIKMKLAQYASLAGRLTGCP